MTTISCLAIDDEPYALELLHHHVEQLPYLEWCGGYQQPLEALSLLNSGAIQLLFLDINMPKINGMAFYRSLNHKPPVIFTTAYAEYAVDAFAIDAIDYLVKPILLDRFIQACNKALTKSSSPASQSIQTIETIYLKSGSKWHQVNWNEVSFLEKDENYVIFHVAGNRKILTRQNLSDVEQSMPSYFCRIHKSFIVNINRVEIVERDQITIGAIKIPLADSYRNAFMKLNQIK